MSLKQHIADYLDDTTESGRWITIAIAVLILVSAGVFVVETYPIPDRWRAVLSVLDWVILAVFTTEYGLRWWSSDRRWAYPTSLYGLLDLVAILPFLLGLLDMRFVRLLRWLRILRLVRYLGDRTPLGRFTAADTLAMVRIIFTLFAIIFIYAGVIFQVEQIYHAQTFRSFFDAAYFAVVTMTTVGYGDITPVSEAGRLFTMLMILTGIALIPTQLGNLIRQIVKVSQSVQVPCNQCGWPTHDPDAKFCKHCGTVLSLGMPRTQPDNPPTSVVATPSPLPFAPRITSPLSANPVPLSQPPKGQRFQEGEGA